MRSKFRIRTFRLFYLLAVLTLFTLLAFPVWAQFQLVESVPVETTLGDSLTFRTTEVWLEMIRSAQSSIDLAFFYVSNQPGEPLEAVLDALKSAAQRGVRIRILSDAKMYRTYPEPLNSLKKTPDIQVRITDFFHRLGGVLHAKYFIVDGQEAFVGSQNLDWRALKHIHETGFRIQNRELARELEEVFNFDWKMYRERDLEEASLKAKMLTPVRYTRANPFHFTAPDSTPATAFLTFSPRDYIPPGGEWDEEQLVRLIDSARERVEVQLLSYKPVSRGRFYEKLDNALRRAAVRGVQVRMIVSNWNLKPPHVQYLKSLQIVPNIEIKISAIPEWSGGFIPYARVEHCKFLVVDDTKLWLGTSNWAYNYFYESRNLGVVMESPYFNRLLHRIFQRSWESPYGEILDVCKDYTAPKIGG